MKKNRIIIALAGDKGAGKDTIASMLEYIMNVGVAAATYKDWYIKYITNEDSCENVIHFADKLKELCSKITNLPLHYFNNSDYKDRLWWVYGTEYFVPEDTIENKAPYTIQAHEHITYVKIDTLLNTNLSEELKKADKPYTKAVIKLRTILQFVGTEMFRGMFDKKYWINDTLKRAMNIINEKDYCIIADLRFRDESTEIRYFCNRRGYKYLIISIGKEEEFVKAGNERALHMSDRQIKDFDCYIQNTKDSYFKLFTKVLEIYQNQILE